MPFPAHTQPSPPTGRRRLGRVAAATGTGSSGDVVCCPGNTPKLDLSVLQDRPPSRQSSSDSSSLEISITSFCGVLVPPSRGTPAFCNDGGGGECKGVPETVEEGAFLSLKTAARRLEIRRCRGNVQDLATKADCCHGVACYSAAELQNNAKGWRRNNI
jgi:hypothetical protein